MGLDPWLGAFMGGNDHRFFLTSVFLSLSLILSLSSSVSKRQKTYTHVRFKNNQTQSLDIYQKYALYAGNPFLRLSYMKKANLLLLFMSHSTRLKSVALGPAESTGGTNLFP